MKKNSSRRWPKLLSAAAVLSGIISGLVAVQAQAYATNPTPDCVGSTCTVIFQNVNDYYLWEPPIEAGWMSIVAEAPKDSQNRKGERIEALFNNIPDQLFIRPGIFYGGTEIRTTESLNDSILFASGFGDWGYTAGAYFKSANISSDTSSGTGFVIISYRPAPRVIRFEPAVAGRAESEAHWLLEFNQPVTDLTVSDFNVSRSDQGCVVAGVYGSGASYDILVNSCTEGNTDLYLNTMTVSGTELGPAGLEMGGAIFFNGPPPAPTPTASAEPVVSPTPSVSSDPNSSPAPTASSDPSTSPEPSPAPDSSASPAPSLTPDSSANPEPVANASTASPSPTAEPVTSPTPTSSPAAVAVAPSTPEPPASPAPSTAPAPSTSPEAAVAPVAINAPPPPQESTSVDAPAAATDESASEPSEVVEVQTVNLLGNDQIVRTIRLAKPVSPQLIMPSSVAIDSPPTISLSPTADLEAPVSVESPLVTDPSLPSPSVNDQPFFAEAVGQFGGILVAFLAAVAAGIGILRLRTKRRQSATAKLSARFA